MAKNRVSSVSPLLVDGHPKNLIDMPEDRDVVVDTFSVPGKHERVHVYLRNVPDEAEYSFSTRAEAVAHALAWAEREHVQAWLTRDWCNFSRLEAA